MEDTLIQWHPAFVAAIELELAENRKELSFEEEYNLNTRPLEIDLLVIKKEPSVQIKNEIGHFFRSYNLLEYKSPGDQLDIDVLYKVIGYACLYKAYGESVNSRPAEEITVSFVRETKPEKLFRYFMKQNIGMTNPFPGIYYIPDSFPFPLQFLVTKELKSETHLVLKALTRELQKENFWKLLDYAKSLQEKLDRNLMDSVLEVSVQANEARIKEWKGDDNMCQALLEIMGPELKKMMEPEIRERLEPEIQERMKESKTEGRKEGRREGRKEGITQGIQNLILTLQELNLDRDKIEEILLKRYLLTKEELAQYLQETI